MNLKRSYVGIPDSKLLQKLSLDLFASGSRCLDDKEQFSLSWNLINKPVDLFFVIRVKWSIFEFQASNDMNETLLKKINGAGNIHLVPSKIEDIYFLRFAICSRFSESKDIQSSWREIKLRADELLEEQSIPKWWRAQITRGCRALAPATCNQS